ncbi:50S ribosomal protein L6 [candidate division WOR-3 bacterium]|nr:50S ribosomal protein L6 [candidate division WOR-3 bacterium]
MSRVGKKPINIPSGVKVEIAGEAIKIEGPLGKLEQRFPVGIEFSKEDNILLVSRKNDNAGKFQGLARAVVANMIDGVTKGVQKQLEIVGVGYRATVDKEDLVITIGYSHPIRVSATPPAGISSTKVKTSQWIKKLDGIKFDVSPDNTQITVKGFDKQTVGQMAALIRSIRPPEPYKGKGIKYKGEWIRRKAGKAAATGAK